MDEGIFFDCDQLKSKTKRNEIKMRINTLKILLLRLMMLVSLLVLTGRAEEEKPQVLSPPDSEVHVFDLTIKEGLYRLENGVNISNNLGYDNQPFFTDKSDTMLFVSVRDGKQTDVFEYDLNSQKTTQITNTPHSEYSPKTLNDNQNVTFVSEGGDPYQSVWSLNRMTGKSAWLLNSKEPVGYYAVNEQNGDVLFWSRYGWSVQYLNLERDERRFVSGHAIPSSPQPIPNSERFSFVHRQTNGEVWIKAFNPKDFSITPIAPIFGSNYDYTWAPNGDILRVENNQLFVWPSQKKNNRWQKGQDLNQHFSGQITRLAVSQNGKYIALVENR